MTLLSGDVHHTYVTKAWPTQLRRPPLEPDLAGEVIGDRDPLTGVIAMSRHAPRQEVAGAFGYR